MSTRGKIMSKLTMLTGTGKPDHGGPPPFDPSSASEDEDRKPTADPAKFMRTDLTKEANSSKRYRENERSRLERVLKLLERLEEKVDLTQEELKAVRERLFGPARVTVRRLSPLSFTTKY